MEDGCTLGGGRLYPSPRRLRPRLTPTPSTHVYARKNISTGIGFRLKPELADVSLLSVDSQLCRLGERHTTAGGVLECGVR